MTFAATGCTTSLSDYVRNGFKVGPNYDVPPAPLTQKWVDEKNSRVKDGDPNLATWWGVFDDPILNGLIERANARNLTVRAAAFQILAAQEARGIAVGELFPQTQTFGAAITRVQASANQGSSVAFGSSAGAGLAPGAFLAPVGGSTGTTTPNSPNVSTGVGGAAGSPGVSVGVGRFFTNNATSLNASWEADFWGLFRRNLEAADATLDQSIANRNEIVVILLANVATQYVQYRTLQKRLDLARKNVEMQIPLVDIMNQRFKVGTANSEPAYYQLKSNLDNTRALIPPLESALRQANNQLCLLLGMPVRDLSPELGDGMIPDLANPKNRVVRIPRPKTDDVVVGIPAEMLLRRPDVVAAERQLQIQSAQIGIAEAEMFPHVGLNGSIGLAANSFNQVLSKHSWTGSIGPSLNWSILNYGRLLGNVRLQNATYQQFVAQYQNTVLTANQDAESAMVAYLQSLDQAKRLQESADAASNAHSYYRKILTKGALPGGVTDTGTFATTLFTIINFQVSQQDAAAQAEGNIALNLILLYRAMGGGWQNHSKNGCSPKLDSGPDDYNLPVTAPAMLLPPQLGVEPRPALGAPVTVEVPSEVRPIREAGR